MLTTTVHHIISLDFQLRLPVEVRQTEHIKKQFEVSPQISAERYITKKPISHSNMLSSGVIRSVTPYEKKLREMKNLCEEQSLSIQIWRHQSEEKDRKIIRQEILINQLQRKIKSLQELQSYQTSPSFGRTKNTYPETKAPQQSPSKSQSAKQTTFNSKKNIDLQHTLRQIMFQLQDSKNFIVQIQQQIKEQLQNIHKKYCKAIQDLENNHQNQIACIQEALKLQINYQEEKVFKSLQKTEFLAFEINKQELVNYEQSAQIEKLLQKLSE